MAATAVIDQDRPRTDIDLKDERPRSRSITLTRSRQQMKRIRIVGLALLAVFAVAAVASATASATACTTYCWKVGAKTLEEGEEAALKGEASSSYTLTGKAFGFIEIAVTCKKAATTGKLLGGEPGKDEATIKYTECSSSSCTPHEPIETKAKSEVVLYTEGGKKYWGDLFTAKESSGIFTVIECTLKAEVTGSIVGELLNEAKAKLEAVNVTEEAFGYVNFTGSNSSNYTNQKAEEKTAELKWEGKAATLKGTSLIALNSGKVYAPGN
jgi:hypothetical protein